VKKSAIFDLFLHCGVRATNVGRELNMNKVFKVVWSATKHAYVVTSELAKSHQKSATTIVAAVILAASFSGGVANASSPEDWARADLIGSQRWLTPDQNAWGHMQDQHQVDPQQLDQQQTTATATTMATTSAATTATATSTSSIATTTATMATTSATTTAATTNP